MSIIEEPFIRRILTVAHVSNWEPLCARRSLLLRRSRVLAGRMSEPGCWRFPPALSSEVWLKVFGDLYGLLGFIYRVYNKVLGIYIYIYCSAACYTTH